MTETILEIFISGFSLVRLLKRGGLKGCTAASLQGASTCFGFSFERLIVVRD